MSLQCTEVSPGSRPSVEGQDESDWCVVDAGKLLPTCKTPADVNCMPLCFEMVPCALSIVQLDRVTGAHAFGVLGIMK